MCLNASNLPLVHGLSKPALDGSLTWNQCVSKHLNLFKPLIKQDYKVVSHTFDVGSFESVGTFRRLSKTGLKVASHKNSAYKLKLVCFKNNLLQLPHLDWIVRCVEPRARAARVGTEICRPKRSSVTSRTAEPHAGETGVVWSRGDWTQN